MKKNLYYIFYIGVLMMFLAGCQDEGLFTPEEETSQAPVNVSFQVKLGGEEMSRAIGDASRVNQLIVGVFQGNSLLDKYTFKREEGQENFTNVTIPMFKNQQYDLVFWAQVKDNDIYSIDNNFNINIDYSKYQDISLVGTESFEAFSAIRREVTVANGGGDITLTRPFAQVNVAASEAGIKNVVKCAVLELTNLPKSYNPLTGDLGTEKVNKIFTFTDFTTSDDDLLQPSGDTNSYIYLASVWALPTTTNIKVNLYDNSNRTIRDEISFNAVQLKANVRLNIVGNMIQQEELQGWDGITFTEPTDEGLSCEVTPEDMGLEEDVQPAEILHIDTPEELAWCMQNGYPEGIKVIHICSNLNMGGHDWNDLPAPEGTARSSRSVTPYSIPAGVTIVGESPKGTLPFVVSNIKVSSTGLFGDAESLTIKNIIFKSVHVSVQSSDAGVLVGTLKGNSLFQNVILEDCSVNASLNAGGMVGYISRKDGTNRAETLTVSFNGCQVNKTNLYADNTGKFVGLFNGYDYQEVLRFDAECASSETTENTNSPYREGNESAWLSNTDYTNYNGWLGNEKYYRGDVTFGDNCFVPKWDGTTIVEPLLANTAYDSEVTAAANKFVVYSPFDLAGVRKKTASPAAIYLRADIDMNGQGADGEFNVPSNFTQSAHSSTDDNVFDPFNYVTTLDGYKDAENNYSIYNLSIAQIEQERAAFILYASGTTVHKNINFRNCQTVAVHKPVETDAKAYGAILVSNVDATYTMENVHAYDCKVFALQKVGTLGARISGTSTLTNNSVNNCYVENYECNISEYFTSGDKEIAGYLVDCHENFFPHGEVGGMFGFIQGNSSISNCNVNSTRIYGFGQNDKKAKFTIKDKNGKELNWLLQGLANIAVNATGLYLIPGRHVSTFIGDIRATGAITIANSVSTGSQCLNRQDKHNNTYDYLGQCYYVQFLDNMGSVTVDGKALTLADCNSNTKR